MEKVIVNIPIHNAYMASRKSSLNNVFEVAFVDKTSRFDKIIVCAGCEKEDLANIIENHIVPEFPYYIEIKQLDAKQNLKLTKTYLKEFIWILDNITLQVVNSGVRERIRFV